MEKCCEMIKGVNKQIIEIRCPKDEQFEKILLFVNSEKCPVSQGDLDEKAKMISKRFLAAQKKNRSGPGRAERLGGRLVIGAGAAAAACMVVCAFVFFV